MLVNCIAYLGGQKLGDIKVEEISNHIHHPDHFVWVDRYFQVVDVLEYELELIEEQIFTKGIIRLHLL